MTRFLSIPLLLVGLSSAFAAPDPKQEADQLKHAQALVQKLGAPQFREREAAARELMLMGRGAKAALIAGQASNDPEIWHRCRLLLPRALALDLAVRVEAFLKDTEGKQKHDLPMWENYRKLVGEDGNSRKLFADMLNANASLMESAELEPERIVERYNARTHDMQMQLWGPWSGATPRPGLNPADVAALLFLGCDPTVAKATQNNFMVSNFIGQPQFISALRDEKTGVAFKKLFFTWMDRRTDDNSINQCLWVIQNNNIKEGVEFALKVAQMKGTQLYIKGTALTAVGKLGGKEHIPALEALFKDDTQISPFAFGNLQGTVQVRDVALAMALHLNGKHPKDYGYKVLQQQPAQMFQYYFLGFTSDKERQESFKKWQDEFPAKKK